MRSPKIIFDEAAALSVKMPSARYTNPHTGQEFLVQPEGTPLRAGHCYYDSHMKDHVRCVDCTVPVFLDGMEHAGRKGSTFESRTPHFRPYPGKSHDADCDYYKSARPSPRKTIDKSKGFLVHLDVGDYSALFTKTNGVYDQAGRLKDADLRDRETITIRSAAAFEKFMRKHDTRRVTTSVIIFNNEKYDWKDFLIRYNHGKGAQNRFIHLVERLESMGKDAQLPCLMEVQTERSHIVGEGYMQTRSVRSKAVPYRMTGNGQKEDIVPSVYIGRDADGVMTIGPNTFVLGMARLNKFTKGQGADARTTYFINMTVHDRAQLADINIENVAAKARARRASASDQAQKLGLSPS